MNIGIIGVGNWGKNLLRIFSIISNINIKRVANKHDVKWIKTNYPGIEATLDYQDILNDESIDAVVIAVPHSELFTIARDAIKSGKHVFIEKPMAETVNQANELMNLKKEGQIIFTGYLFLHHPIYKRIKEITSSDPPLRVNTTWTKSGTFNNDIILNLASHDIAIMLDMFGSIPTNVALTQSSDDKVDIRLWFSNGEGSININRDHPIERKEVQICTSNGKSLYWIDSKLYEPNWISESKREALLDECNQFIDCIENGVEPVTNGRMGYRILKVIKMLEKKEPDQSNKDYVISKYGLKNGLPTINILDLFPSFEENVDPYSFLDGTSSPIDIALLKALARRYDNCRYLEIGTWRGESVANVAGIADKCFSIDLSEEEMKQRQFTNRFIKNMRLLSKDISNIHHINHSSRTFDFSIFKEGFDLIFIDGDHDYEGLKADTENAFKLLRNEKSIIVWHDYGLSPEKVRWIVLAAILDGCPEEKRKDLFHVSNTISAMYTTSENKDIIAEYLPMYCVPKNYFEVKIKKSGEVIEV